MYLYIISSETFKKLIETIKLKFSFLTFIYSKFIFHRQKINTTQYQIGLNIIKFKLLIWFIYYLISQVLTL